MNSNNRAFVAAATLIALGSVATAHADIAAAAAEYLRTQRSDRSSSSGGASSEAAPAPAPTSSGGRGAEPPRRSEPQPRGESPPRGEPRLRSQPQPRDQQQPRNEPRGDVRNDRDRRDHDDRPNNGGRDHDSGHHDRPSRTVYVLPPLHRDYFWGGDWYYTWDGLWYRSFGGSYATVRPPYGMFVSSLPGYSTSFYYGSTRYYYYDDTYYTFDGSRRGYVVAASPYDGEESDDAADDEDLFVYPAQGQSEQQQADDRYACHRWAVKQTDYDPIDAAYDRVQRADYTRAITACLTGRGYTAR